MALAGDGHITVAPETCSALSRAGFLSKTPGLCKTFWKDADGYARGEGVGVVVLKRLEDPVADKDNILAVVRGAAPNYSWDATSITQPSAMAQSKMVEDTLRVAGVEPDEVGYVEMHGNGTQSGDTAEIETVTRVFARRPQDNPLYVGAVKANVGHSEASAGICSVVKAIEMLQRSKIPPQPGFLGNEPNPKFAHVLDAMNIRIPDEMLPLTSCHASGGTKKILVNNFDASGGNNFILL